MVQRAVSTRRTSVARIVAYSSAATAGVVLFVLDLGQKAGWPRGPIVALSISGMLLLAAQLHALSLVSRDRTEIVGAWFRSGLATIGGAAAATVAVWCCELAGRL